METMKLNNFDRLVLASLLLATIVNIFSDYVIRNYQWVQNWLFPLVIIISVLWVASFLTRIVAMKVTAGRYAVEAYVLNEQYELLLYYHPFHHKHLPPGGRVYGSEFPDDALRNRLSQRLGLLPNDYTFVEAFHPDLNRKTGVIGNVERVPTPFMVQKEIHKQRAFVKFHYDFFYVLRLQTSNHVFPENEYKPVRFVDRDTLRQLVASRETFPDVFDAYERILHVITERDLVRSKEPD